VPGATKTVAAGINASGQIVGTFADATGSYGYLLSRGKFTGFDVPGATQTLANGINAAGQIVGSFDGKGFLLSRGMFTTLNIPGATYVFPTGVNGSGQVVGYYDRGPGDTGFLLDRRGLTNVLFDGFSTVAAGINDSGEVVGYYLHQGNRGFILDSSGYHKFDIPGAGLGGTAPFGVNDSGQIVGNYYDANHNVHGFIATPVPEPSSLAMFGVGVAVLAVWQLRKVRKPRVAGGRVLHFDARCSWP
jgi:uncharacterized membrane protein